jgi:hypothetical protein
MSGPLTRGAWPGGAGGGSARGRARALRAGAGLAGVMAGFLSACFHYRPVELGTVPVGQDVRLRLTRVGWAGLPEHVPSRDGATLRGTLLSSNGEQVLLRVPIAAATQGLVSRAVGQDVAVPASHIVQLEFRQLDRVRTGLAVAGAILGGGAIFMSFREGDPEGAETQQQSEEEAGVNPAPGGVRIPLLTLRFRH